MQPAPSLSGYSLVSKFSSTQREAGEPVLSVRWFPTLPNLEAATSLLYFDLTGEPGRVELQGLVDPDVREIHEIDIDGDTLVKFSVLQYQASDVSRVLKRMGEETI